MASGSWTYYYGNAVSYGSGSYFQSIIGIYDDGSNTGGSTGVTYRYSLYSRYSLSDSSNSVSWSDPWGSQPAFSVGFSHGGGGGETVVGGPYGNQHGIQYGGGNTAHFTLSVSGLAGVGGTSTCDVYYPLPARSPGVPSAPSYGFRNISTSGAWTTGVSVADAAGGTMNNIWGQWGLDGNYGLGSATTGSWTDLQFTGCPPGRVIYTRLAVGNNYNWSAWSPSSFTTAAGVPGAPSADVKNITATSAHVYVATPGAENGASAAYCEYVLYRNDGTLIGYKGGSAAAGIGYAGVVWDGLDKASPYRVHARTWNSAGWSAWTAGGTNFTTLATVPDTMAAPTVPTIGNTTATVNYVAPANGGSAITGYTVQWATNAGFTTGVGTVASTTLSGNITGLTAATPYWTRVLATNAIGNSVYSPATQFTAAATVPAAPAVMTLTNWTDSTLTLNWVAPANNGGAAITGYRLQFSLSSSFATTIFDADVTGTSYAFVGLQPVTRYWMHVAAINSVGRGAYSTLQSADTLSGLMLNVANTWKRCELWMNVAGTWKVITLYVDVGGAKKKIT